MPSGVRENWEGGLKPSSLASALALKKARSVARCRRQCVVLGADTLVVLGREVLGKPKSNQEASAMLQRLRGRWHRVITGLALICPGRAPFTAYCVTRVLMRKYNDREIQKYAASGRARDKAGAYAIQDRRFHPVVSLKGCACNVMGLPLSVVSKLLKKAGFELKPKAGLLKRVCRFCHQRIKERQEDARRTFGTQSFNFVIFPRFQEGAKRESGQNAGGF